MRVPALFIVLAFVLAGCSKSPKEFADAATAAYETKNFQLAIEEHEKLIAAHPDSPEAEEAMYMIAQIRNNDIHDFAAAANGYKRYVDAYPDGKHTALAMFLIGYLNNNELHNLDVAKTAYEAFLAKYPSHEMAASAQFELQNLGKSPEELLPPVPEEPVASTQQPKKVAGKKN